MTCQCSDYPALELAREDITRRIRQTKKLAKALSTVAESGDLRLMECRGCGQMWQSGREWNFRNAEYLFQVPSTTAEAWHVEKYVQPAAMLIYSAVMSQYWEGNEFVPSAKPCRNQACERTAVTGSVFCTRHHIEELQRLGMLPTPPPGRFFPPYSRDGAPTRASEPPEADMKDPTSR